MRARLIRLLSALVVALMGIALLAPPVGASAGGRMGAGVPSTVVNTQAPWVKGAAVYDTLLKAKPGRWEPAAVTFAYQWLRDGSPIASETTRTYRVRLHDLGRRISVAVTATDETGATGTATSEETDKVRRATLRNKVAPSVNGILRFTHTVRARPGRWSTTPTRVRYQWYRSGREIAGATGQRYAFAPRDVGRHVRVRVEVKAPGYRASKRISPRGERVAHRLDVRRTVRYHVETRGAITTSLIEFRRQAQQTYGDPRGWRGAGIRFREVASGGSFTLVLAEASTVPGFSSSCSSMWSCRVGRYVIINQERWKHASPAWNAARGSRRDYRHMVVNHETGHWLGLGHAGCPGPGQLAPVMMQQSKGLGGCRFNPWPTGSELARRSG